jgi:stearoyl-CoA desaturase (delta-9 desaturase)
MSTDTLKEQAPINWVTSIVITTTFLLAAIVTPWYGFTYGFSTAAWVLFFLFMGANGMAITAGYHRLWSHRTYTAHWAIRVPLMLFGTMALQASILQWASNHRTHHQFVDDNDRDPYSANRGFWFSHVGWMLREYPSAQTDFSNVPDIKEDKIAMFQHRYYLPLVLLTNFGFTLLAGWAVGDVWGVFWLAGMARLVLSHHVTWFINSLAHAWGSRPYTDKNTARDNGILALITYGEGYHNFHHLYASDYRNGVRWYQFDPTKWLIYGLSLVGLTSNLRRMPDVTIQQARVAMQFKRLEEKLTCPKAAGTFDLEKLRAQLAHETEAFRNTLAEWAKVRDAWYADTRKRLMRRWEKAHFRTHSREVLYRLRMQHRRLALLNAQFA